MADLQTLQKTFVTDLQQRTDHSLPLIQEDDHLSAKQRLQVYQNNYSFLLTDMLMGNFPSTCTTVSEEFFRFLASEFIKKHPLPTAGAGFYHLDFPDFLETFPPLLDYPFVPDLARLEVLLHQSYIATPPSKTILHPSVFLLESDYPVRDIWQVAQGQRDENDLPTMENNPQKIILYQDGYDVCLDVVEDDFFTFVQSLQAGETKDQAAEKALKINPVFDINVTVTKMKSNDMVTE